MTRLFRYVLALPQLAVDICRATRLAVDVWRADLEAPGQQHQGVALLNSLQLELMLREASLIRVTLGGRREQGQA